MTDQATTSTLHIRHEVVIHAPRDAVWRALTEEVSDWWDHRFFEDSTLTFEPVAGGAFKEVGPAGEALFATVQRVVREETLAMVGPMGMRVPCTNLMTYTLADEGTGTRVTIEHLGTGLYTDEHRSGYARGWADLLEGRLKRYCEATV